MKLFIRRIQGYKQFTAGLFYINNALKCFTLEDEYRLVKIHSETRIPAGIYKVSFQKTGKMHELYSKKFPFHLGMLHIENVPNFQGIFIHIGNTDLDTAGCPLVACAWEIGENMVLKSTKAYTEIYKIIAAELVAGKEVTIQITDEMLN